MRRELGRQERRLDPEELVEYLVRRNPVTQADVARHFGVSRNTAKYWLEKLVEAGVLREVAPRRVPGSTKRGATYTLASRVTPTKHALVPVSMLALTTVAAIAELGRGNLSVLPLALLSYAGCAFSFLWYLRVVGDRIRRLAKELAA